MRQFALSLRRLGSRLGLERDWYLILLAMFIGLLMGGVAVLFILPLQAIERWVTQAPAGTLRWLTPTAPIVGALLAGVVIKLFAVKGAARGPGVSTVMYAIHRKHAVLPIRVAARKWLSSSFTIGSGGSAGAEGPIVTIGAVIGSNFGRLLGVNPQHRATLLGCGAAAGIAAVFNAPIAGIFFVLEILLRDFSLRTFTPIVIASVVSAATAQGILGDDPIFAIEGGFFRAAGGFTLAQIPNFLVLGLLCGAAAAVFIRGLFLSEAMFDRLRAPTILKPALGAVVLGGLGVLYLVVFDDPVPAFYGNGYPFIENLLHPEYYPVDPATGELAIPLRLIGFLCALAILKAIATCMTIGSGGAGGMFAPSLLIGAALGGALGSIVNALDWFPAAHPASYALVGMGAMVAATTRAPLTGILIVYEITRSYETILPLMLAAVIGTITAKLIYRESVYTVKLTQLGVRIGAMSDLTILRRLYVYDVPLVEAVVVREGDNAQRLLDLSEQTHVADFVVTDESGVYCGMVTSDDLKAALVYREAIPLLQVNELLRSDLPTVAPDDTLDRVLDKFSRHDVQSLAVLDGSAGDIRGLITRSRLMMVYQSVLDEE